MHHTPSRRLLFLAIVSSLFAAEGSNACAAELIDVHIGMGLPKPPYVLSPGNGGLDYEIAEKVLARAGYRMIGHQYPPARALALMRANQLDGVLSVTEGIGGNGYFSRPYVTYYNVAISLTKNNFKIASVADLRDYSVAGFQNARMLLGPDYRDVVNGHASYQEVADQKIQNRLLYAGRVDVIVGDRYIFYYYNRDVGALIDLRQAVTFHEIFPPAPRLLVFRDRTVRDQFDAALRSMEQSGAIRNLYKKYDVAMPR